MKSKILINAVDPEEIRMAKVTDSRLSEFHIESSSREVTQGNIYKGVITRIEPSLQAVFVDYGAERNGFLQKHEIHSDYYQDHAENKRNIRTLLKVGQELLVQVTKDPINKKGAMLTTFLSLAGRYIVLMPGNENRGISRKIEDETERKRLREIVHGLKLPDGFGVIIRTAGINCTKTLINKDFNYLMRLWKSIKGNVMQVPTPQQMYQERNLVVRVIRDYLTPEVGEILIDEEDAFKEVRDFVGLHSPKHNKIVRHYKGAKPIFSKFQLEDQIASIYRSNVPLKSGGSIVIEQTEALVSIDVNSGKGTHKESIEQTALMTNLEAAEEIARQLRLRDLGGLIVLDFIDMRDAKHKQQVERTLKINLKADKARSKVGRISQFGLLEMSRQRIRPSIDFTNFETCPHCKGRGQVPSTESMGLSFLRQLTHKTLKQGYRQAQGTVPPAVAGYLLNRKRRELIELESRRSVTISITADPNMAPGENRIILEK